MSSLYFVSSLLGFNSIKGTFYGIETKLLASHGLVLDSLNRTFYGIETETQQSKNLKEASSLNRTFYGIETGNLQRIDELKIVS